MTMYSARHINFLEESRQTKKELFSLNYFWILAIFIVFASSGVGYYTWQKGQIESLRQKIDKSSAELNRLKAAELGRSNNKGSDQLIKEVLQRPIRWSELVRDTIQKVPPGIELIQLSGALGDSRKLLVKGRSPFLNPIFYLKDNLAELKQCQNTTLVSVEQMRGGSSHQKLEFHLECNLL